MLLPECLDIWSAKDWKNKSFTWTHYPKHEVLKDYIKIGADPWGIHKRDSEP